MPRELLVFIHGVSSTRTGGPHVTEYQKLYGGVKGFLLPESDWNTSQRCDVEWGWNYDRVSDPEGHRQLARAQSRLGARVLRAMHGERDWSFNFISRAVLNCFRPLLLAGFSDMFYYVSQEGKQSVRTTVAEQIVARLRHVYNEDGRVSLTLLGHSAGSVIAHDVAFFLYYPHAYEFVHAPSESMRNSLLFLRERAASGTLRLRRLITFGSPLSMLACRNHAVIDMLAHGDVLDPAWYGLAENPAGFEKLTGPRWLNFWDKDDPISFPVEPLVDNRSRLVRDLHVNASDSIATAHDSYWDSPLVHEQIARLW